jgi:4-hydroxy-tetrahydrodipicolinate synthase
MFTELITPFNEDGSIDYDMMAGLVDFQVDNGVTNFFVNGLGAECHCLSNDEKMKLLEIVRRQAGPDATLMACSFEGSLMQNKELLQLYMDSGLCDCYCITAPPYFRHTTEALYDWAEQLISYCDKPCYIYNSVQMGTLFDPDTLEKLWKNVQNFRGYKDATTDMIHFMQVLLRIDKESFDFLGGCDATDGLAMLMGAVGCVSFMAVPFPAQMKEIVDYGLAGEAEKCMDAQYRVLKIRNALKKSPFNAAYMYAQNFTGGPVVKRSRMPEHQDYVSDEVKADIDRVMKELGISK